jgi:hypothetical protein
VDALREDFPRQSSYAMCDGPDCLFIGKPREEFFFTAAAILTKGRVTIIGSIRAIRITLLDGFDLPGAVTISSVLADKNPASTDTDFRQVWWPAGPWELL